MAEIENGALIEGADGALYFIPDTILAQYKVEGDAADLGAHHPLYDNRHGDRMKREPVGAAVQKGTLLVA